MHNSLNELHIETNTSHLAVKSRVFGSYREESKLSFSFCLIINPDLQLKVFVTNSDLAKGQELLVVALGYINH